MPIEEPGLTGPTRVNSIDRSFDRAVKANKGPGRLSAIHRRLIMTPISRFHLLSGSLAALAFAVSVAVWGTIIAFAAQDKYTVQVPTASRSLIQGIRRLAGRL